MPLKREENSHNSHPQVERNSSTSLLNGEEELQCDYLVVGAGTSGMSFVDTILTEKPSATVIIVDRNDGPGGHWLHVYPFCKLHQTSCNYGVNSVPLAKIIDAKGNEIYDIRDRATGEEVVEYYKKVCDKFKATGRVKCFFGAEYDKFDKERGVHIILPKSCQDNNSDQQIGLLNVKCGKLVQITNNVTVPSMRKPVIPVHENVNFVSVNEMPSSVKNNKFQNYIVFGCGKTGADAIVNLLQSGINQSQIKWIVSRDVWYMIREAFEDFWGSMDIFIGQMNRSNSVKELYLKWEENGVLARLDPNGPVPKILKGPTMDAEEITMIQSIQGVVRMGRATSVEDNKILLDRGSLDFSSVDTLLVDCMVDSFYGYGYSKNFEIFEPGRINLGPLTVPFNASFSAARTAFLECAGEDDETKNNCCCLVREEAGKDLAGYENIVGAIYLQGKGDKETMKLPGGRKFMMGSRTNVMCLSHYKRGMIRLLWFLYGPQRGISITNKLEKKLQSKGFSDLDHSFDDHYHQKTQVEPLNLVQKETFGSKLINWMVISLILGLVIQWVSHAES